MTTLSLVLLAAAASASTQQVSYYEHVRPVLVEHCLTCHSGAGVAFRLDDAESAYDFRAAIVDSVLGRRMPPWMAEPGHQAYADDPSLSTEVLAMIELWRSQGFPKGQFRSDPKPRPADTFKPHISLDAMPNGPYAPSDKDNDDYHCFVFDWPKKEPTYITGIRVRPGNLKIAHHAILYAIPGAHRALLREFSEAEDGNGFSCLGGPLPDRVLDPERRKLYDERYPDGIASVQRDHYWLAHWAPGMDGYRFPSGAGIHILPGTVLILQMHYFTGFSTGIDPKTMVDFRLAKSVRKPGFNWPLSDTRWLDARNNGSLVVPPRASLSVTATSSLDGLDMYIAALSKRSVSEFAYAELHSVNLHMHLIGAAGNVSYVDARGNSETLLDVERYLFGWQRDFQLKTPKRIALKDLGRVRLSVQCRFANPHESPVYGGYGSDEEMCYNFSFISLVPKLPDRQQRNRRFADP